MRWNLQKTGGSSVGVLVAAHSVNDVNRFAVNWCDGEQSGRGGHLADGNNHTARSHLRLVRHLRPAHWASSLRAAHKRTVQHEHVFPEEEARTSKGEEVASDLVWRLSVRTAK